MDIDAGDNFEIVIGHFGQYERTKVIWLGEFPGKGAVQQARRLAEIVGLPTHFDPALHPYSGGF